MSATHAIRFLLAGTLALSAAGCSRIGIGGPAPAAGPRHGSELLAEMHSRYAAHVPKALSFSQTNTVYTGTGQVKQSVRVLVGPPDRMRVDFLPLSGRNGALYLGTRAMSVTGGRRSALAAQPNPALLFPFTVFSISPDSTRRLLESLGIDLSRVRRDEFNGAEAWVVGAREGDLSSNQVWISARRLLPLRHIRNERRGSATVVTDTRFGTFREFKGFPMATAIEVYRDGRLAMKQSISRVRTDVTLPSGTFDQRRWVQVPLQR